MTYLATWYAHRMDNERDHGQWNPDDLLRSLQEESEVFDLPPKEMAEKKFKDAVAFAADSVIWVSRYSPNEKLRFDASRYIVDRVLGKPTDGLGKTDLFEKFLNDVEVEANTGGK